MKATQSAANHDHIGCHRKAPLYAGQSVSVINNDTDAVKPDTNTKLEVAGQPVTTPSTSEAVQLQQAPTAPTVQPPVAPATPKQAAAQGPTVATHTQRKTTVTTDIQPPTGRTDVAPCQSGCISKAPQCLIEHM